jgi:hypothetical protein
MRICKEEVQEEFGKSGVYVCNNFGDRVLEALLEWPRYFISKISKVLKL